MKVRVNVSHLQMDKNRYMKGDTLTLPIERVKQLGTSVTILAEEPEPAPVKENILQEDTIPPVTFEEETVPPDGEQGSEPEAKPRRRK
ncbi:hypothetical protein [Methanolobus sp.]|uniref:hypothetical protein n=1 Tax=Methanolobus sp. TaxID=1874737 RepID=UPI002731F058|nr:hypothetical protein [Methanolobus sp.]